MTFPRSTAVWMRPECNRTGIELVTGAEAGRRLGYSDSIVSTWLQRDPSRCPSPCAVDGAVRWFVWDEIRTYDANRLQHKIDDLDAKLAAERSALAAADAVRQERRAAATEAQSAYDQVRRSVAYLEQRRRELAERAAS